MLLLAGFIILYIILLHLGQTATGGVAVSLIGVSGIIIVGIGVWSHSWEE